MAATHPIEWATASFREAMSQGPVKVTFDKWKNSDGEPFTFFVHPVSVEEQDAIWRARADGGVAGLIEVLIQRAKDAAGNRIFTTAHRSTIRREMLSDDLSDIALLINNARPAPKKDLAAALKP